LSEQLWQSGKLTPPNFLTMKQAAALAGMSRWQLRLRVGQERGPPSYRRGVHILFEANEFMAWASQRDIP